MFGTVRVLVADGDSVFRNRIIRAVEERGIVCVGSVPDGTTAAELLRRYRPELFITDIPLRGMDGLSLLELANDGQCEKKTVCAVVTANRDPLLANAAKILGADILEHKPCRADNVIEAALQLYYSREKPMTGETADHSDSK